jgi:hypothetical protein
MLKQTNAYRISDANPVFLGCQVENGALVLTHDGTPLSGRVLALTLAAPAETTVAITNFEHDGSRYLVDAYTLGAGGSLTQWERFSEGARSPTLRGESGEELEVLVRATYEAPSGEVTAREVQDYEPQPSYSLDGVKIRLPPPEDDKPDEPGT